MAGHKAVMEEKSLNDTSSNVLSRKYQQLYEERYGNSPTGCASTLIQDRAKIEAAITALVDSKIPIENKFEKAYISQKLSLEHCRREYVSEKSTIINLKTGKELEAHANFMDRLDGFVKCNQQAYDKEAVVEKNSGLEL